MKKEVTPEQIAKIKTLTRRANRRLERASEGQRNALEYYVKAMTGSTKFSASYAGLTYAQANAKLKSLQKFLDAKSSKISGWKAIKAANVSKANATLQQQGYDLTDKELAEILQQVDTADRKDFYRAVNLVQAAKVESAGAWSGSSSEIADAIKSKATAQEALERAIMARNMKEISPYGEETEGPERA
jgi:hypothetical protein